jgi:tripartite-type tricarboxylate transporter receptor subunit TctC
MPKPLLAKVNDAFARTIATPELRAMLESQGAEPGSGQPQEFAALIRREYDRYAKVVKVSGAKID